MGTHYHLVVRTPRANLSEFMQFLNGRFAQDSNWRHARTGHCSADGFAILIPTSTCEQQQYLWLLARFGIPCV